MRDTTHKFVPGRVSEDGCVVITAERISVYGHSYVPEATVSIIDDLKVKQDAYDEWKRCFGEETK